MGRCSVCGTSLAVQRKPRPHWTQTVTNLAAVAAVVVFVAVTLGKLSCSAKGRRQAAEKSRQDSPRQKAEGQRRHQAQLDAEEKRQGEQEQQAQQAAGGEHQQGQQREPTAAPGERAARRAVEDFEFDAVSGDWFAPNWVYVADGAPC